MKRFVIFDLEATCYENGRQDEIKPDGFDNEIIEIGAVMLDSDGKEISRFQSFAKPKLYPKLSNFCKELTTIKQEDVDNADDLADVLVNFINWCDGATLVSWGFYDKTQLGKDLIKNDLEYLLDDIQDHKSIKHLYAQWKNLRRKGIGLSKALRMEGLKFEGTPHRGIDDAINIANIFRKYIDRF
jgi:inhibitor of KinA sporulation pathway (predicted exonuclease)